MLLIASILTANLIGAAAYGRLGLIQSTIAMVGVLAGCGLGLTSTKYIAQIRHYDAARLGRIIALMHLAGGLASLLLAVILIMGAGPLAYHGLGRSDLKDDLQIGSALMFVNALIGIQGGILTGFEAFRSIAILNVARGILCLIFMVAGAVYGGVRGSLVGLILAGAAVILLGELVLSRLYRDHSIHCSYRYCWNEATVLWQFSLPALISGSVTIPALWAIAAMLARHGDGYVEIGIYNVATQWRNILLFLPTVLGQVLTPILASLWNVREFESIRALLWKGVRLNGLVAGVVALPLLFAGNEILLLSGPDFGNHGQVMVLTALSGLLLSVQTPIGNYIAATGKMWTGAAMNTGWGIVLVVSAKYFLGIYPGAKALAAALLTAYIFHAIWTAAFAAKTLSESAQSNNATCSAGVA